MSLVFKSFEERNKYNSTAFMEIQFCKLSDSKSKKNKVAVRNIKYRSSDSLFIYQLDMYKFLEEYGEIFVNANYSNLKTGLIDEYGINYYQKDQISDFINQIIDLKPTDYEVISKWLKEALSFNGFYILGI